VTVEDGGQFNIGSLDKTKNGVVIAEEDAIIHIKTGGTLHVTGNQSILWIKSGARLILDAGAIVHLESFESKILIEGTLVINGDIIFLGYGHFHFGNGNELEFGPGAAQFRLAGRGLGHRFVRLSSDLDIEAGHGVYWLNGKVEALGGSLLVNNNGHCRFSYVEVIGDGYSDGNEAVIAEGAEHLHFTTVDFKEIGTGVFSKNSGPHHFGGCDFSNVEYGIFAEAGSGSFYIGGCDFEQYLTAVTVSDRPVLTIVNSDWQGDNDATGLDLHRVAQVTLRNSNLNGHANSPGGPFDPSNVFSSYAFAANLDGVPYFIMRNSGMSGNDIGINAMI
jgi:hypothetical protein